MGGLGPTLGWLICNKKEDLGLENVYFARLNCQIKTAHRLQWQAWDMFQSATLVGGPISAAGSLVAFYLQALGTHSITFLEAYK